MHNGIALIALLTLATSAGPDTASRRHVAATAAADDTLRYTALFSGKRAGSMSTARQGNGLRVQYEFNDRGRGPRLTEQLVLDPSGVPSQLEILGHGYLKDSVEEHFRVANGVATWENPLEGAGTSRSPGSFYIGVNGTPAEGGVLARALLAAPQHTLSLLPGGEAKIEKVRDLKVAGRNGDSTSVTLYAIAGLDLTPSAIWLDSNGEFFGAVSSWSSTIRDGYEPSLPALLAAQDKENTARFERLAKTLAHRPTGPVAFTHAAVFDADSARVRPGMTVVVTGDRITAVGPDASVKVPTGADVIDATGRTLIPGMSDMHVHVGNPGQDGLMNIAAGVTAARDLGNDTTAVTDSKRKYDAGTLIGPRLMLAGLIDSPGPFQAPTNTFASTPDEARHLVDRFAALGYEQVKMYSSLKPELVPVIAQAAHAKGMRVSGHVPSTMLAEQVVMQGYDEIQHANFLMLNFMDTVRDTRSMARFTAVAAHGAEIDPSSERVQRFIKLLLSHHTVIDPTLGAFEDMFVARPGHPSVSFGMVSNRFPAQFRRGLLGGGLPVPNGMDQRYRDSFAAMVKMVGAMYRAGVPIVAGTDGLPGFLYDRELELYVQAGIPPAQVMRIATLGAARVMKHDDQRGSIAVGKLADLALVRGDPTQRISDVRNVETVMRGGVLFKSADLYGALGIK